MTEADILDALRVVDDPELGINVVDLGLVYAVVAGEAGVRVEMTTTSPACPLSAFMAETAAAAIRRACPGAGPVEVVMVREPRWTAERMSDAARRALGWG